MDRIESCISFLVNKAAQQVARRTREALAPHGVTAPQYAVLRVLADQEGQSGAEIAARLNIDSATLTGVLDRLEAATLIERRDCGADRRVHRLHRTPRAQQLAPALEAAMDAVNARIAASLGPDAAPLWSALSRLGDVQ